MLEQESQNFYPLPMKSRKGVKEVNSSLEKIEKNLSLLRNMWKLTYEDTAHVQYFKLNYFHSSHWFLICDSRFDWLCHEKISEETLPMLDKRIKVMRELGFSWEIIKETLSREYTQLLKGLNLWFSVFFLVILWSFWSFLCLSRNCYTIWNNVEKTTRWQTHH